MKRSMSILGFVVLLIAMLYPLSSTLAASATKALAPASIVTLTGGAAGAVANLAVQDQSGVADNAAKYVKFTTPGTSVYKGYRQFTLPSSIATSSITAMQVKVNYKGAAKATQRWSWFLYDWAAAKWIYVGDNTAATANTWKPMTFSTTSPKRFVNASRAIRLLLQSDKATGDAKVDYESLNVTYTTPEVTSAIYGDSLVNGWGDWSWDATALANTAVKHAGANSLAVTYVAGWGGLQFGRNDPFSISSYNTLRFWIYGGGYPVRVSASDGTTILTKDITPAAGTWTQVNMPLTGLSQVTLLSWQNYTAQVQSTIYVDDVSFVGNGGPTATPTKTSTPSGGPALSVNVSANRHAISPYIYGMNYAEETLADDIDLPVRRWGGNSTSRYNWQADIHNTGSDWYFENIPEDNDNRAALPNGSAADKFVEQNDRTGTDTLMTVPLIGWTPKSNSPLTHSYACGFKVSKYGTQDSVDPWDTACGNGISGGENITGNDASDTSIPATTTFVANWINHLKQQFNDAANGGVMFYNLDNEPMLWNSTHRDVHPNPTTYDEMKTQTEAYAAAVKAADPTAKTLGPADWGWCAYFFSAADGCSPGGSDRAAHGNVDFVPWYLQQMQAYDTAHSVRILDYLDLHVYPQGTNIYSDVVDTNTKALRLRSTRALWDPTYVDESWIGGAGWEGGIVKLIPRMKSWVNTYYPGTKLAISEYNWGAMGDINGALAQADVLGIFGREGLDLATLWGPPTATQPGAYAFRIYRNYDGSHSTFGDTSVQAASTNQDRVAVYAAQRTSDSALTLIIINKTNGALTSNLSLSGFTPLGNAQVYRYSAASLSSIQRILPDQAVSASGFSASYPANSITLLVIPGN